MERESNQMQTLCRSGCGFYGSPATDGLCSLCYKEALKKKQQLPTSPSGHCNVISMGSTASHTTNNLNQLVAHSTGCDVIDSMSQSHLPSRKNSQECSNCSSKTLLSKNSSSNQISTFASAQNVTSNQCDIVDLQLSQNSVSMRSVEQPTVNSTLEPFPISSETPPSVATAAPETENCDEEKESDKDKKKKNRCGVCRKKVGLTGFECRCGGLFCAVHRYSDKHDCSFNYREMGAQEIRRNNPVVVGEKIQKI